MVLARLKAMALKETKHVRRDVRSLILALGMPLFLLWLFGYALSMDVDNVSTVVLDYDQTPASRDLISRLEASPYFQITAHAAAPGELTRALNSGQALIGLTIPYGFAASLVRAAPESIQVLLDGSDSSTASVALGYVDALMKAYSLETAQARLARLGLDLFEPPLEVRPRVWFNQEAKSKNFIIPGLIVVIIMVMTAQLTALTVAREWESGTLEWLIATPVTPAEVILGKLLPYIVIGVIDVTVTVLVGVHLFDVPFRGEFWLLMVLATLFLIGVLAFGLFISTAARSQLLASQIAVVATFLPSFLLSGFVFPIYNMPLILKGLTYLVPARYLITITKGVFLKGVGFDVLMAETAFLLGFTVLVIAGSIRRFKKRLSV